MIGLFCFLLNTAISLYLIIILIRVLISWVPVDYGHQAVRTVFKLTDPVLIPAKKYLPFLFIGGIDFSPIAVVLLLQYLPRLLCGAL